MLGIPSPLGSGKREGNLDGEDVRTQQVMNPLAEFVTNLDRLVIVRFRQDPFQGHVRVEDVSSFLIPGFANQGDGQIHVPDASSHFFAHPGPCVPLPDVMESGSRTPLKRDR